MAFFIPEGIEAEFHALPLRKRYGVYLRRMWRRKVFCESEWIVGRTERMSVKFYSYCVGPRKNLGMHSGFRGFCLQKTPS